MINASKIVMSYTGWVWILIFFRIVLFASYVGVSGEYLEEDSGYYLWLADILREHHVFAQSDQPPFSPQIFRTPGYPAFLAFFKIIGLSNPYWVCFFQELIYGFSVLIFFRFSKSFFSEKLVRYAVIFLLIEPGGLSVPKMMMSETLFLPFFLGALFAIGYYLKTLNYRYLIYSGVLMGLGAYIRPAILYFPLVIAITLVIFACKDRIRWLHAGALLLAFTLIISPWLLRNYYHFGKLVMSGQQSNMLANYHVPMVWESAKGIPFWRGHEQIKSDVKQAVQQKSKSLDRSLNTVEIMEIEQQLALTELKKHPWHYLKQWGFGILKTMNGANLLGVYHAFRYQEKRVRFFEVDALDFKDKVFTFLINQDYFYIFEVLLRVLIAGFALCGAVWVVIKKDCFFWVFMLANFYFICTPGPMGYARFRFPVEVFWFIQAYFGFIWLLSVIKKRSLWCDKRF